MTAAPAFDEGDPPPLATLWRMLVQPTPGRLAMTLRIVILVLLVTTISETFRIPELAISAYIVLFVSRADAASTILGAGIAGVAATAAILATAMLFMATLAEPALRLPAMAAATFAAMFLARTAGQLGPAFLAFGFIVAYGSTLGDEVLAFALMPGEAANAAQGSLPALVFIPPEEALLRFLLWLALAVALPMVLVIAANLLTGRAPQALLRAGLAARLGAAAGFCAGEPGARRALGRLAGEGVQGLHKLQHLGGLLGRATPPLPIEPVQRLLVLLLAVARVAPAGDAGAALAPLAAYCRRCAHAIASGTALPDAPPAPELGGDAAPLAARIGQALAELRAPPAPASAHEREAGLLAGDAFSNPDHARFAFKVTLAVLACYAAQTLLSWPGIHTCVITCFFVSLTTLGETANKAALRLAGCLVGGALGIGTILWLMPVMTDLGDLLLVVGAVTFAAAWIGAGSERIAYAGWQMALAFYLSTFQGFGPTLDMSTAKDRIIGILLGNAIVYLVFSTVWPVGAAQVARGRLAGAIEQLAELIRPGSAEAAHGAGFAQSIGQAQAALLHEPFEIAELRPAAPRAITTGLLGQVQALFVPLSVVLDLRRELPGAEEVAGYHQALSAWFRRAAEWVRDGRFAAEVARGLPHPPALRGPLGGWHRALDDDLRRILDQIAPSPLRDRA